MMETKFKQTDVGLIPEDWEVKKLGELLSIGNGRDYKHLSYGDVPVYGTGGLMCYVNDYLYDGETVCIGRKGTINVPFYYSGKIWTVDTLFFTHSFNNIVPKYLYYLFLTIDWLSKNEATGVPSLSKINIGQINVAIPPTIEEQERIASALTSIDNLISSLDKQIAKTRHIKQGAMRQLLTFPDNVEFVKFCDICSFIKGVTYSKSEEQGIDADGYRILRANNITLETNTLNFDDVKVIKKTAIVKQEQLLRANDILMCVGSGSKEHIGKVAHINESLKYYFGGFMGVIRVKKGIDSKYLFYILTGKIFKDYLEQAVSCCTINNINSTIINDFTIPVPSIEEQQRIASTLTAMDNQIAALEAKRRKYEMLKQGMMQRLLTGKIRLSR